MHREAPEPSPHSWPTRRPPSVKNIALAAACSALEAQAPVTVSAIMKEIEMSTYESAVQGRRDFREAYRQEREKHTRLHDSYAELLDAAKRALRVLQKLQPHVHMDAAEALEAAIAKAEELGK